MATPKGQLTQPIIEFLATIVTALVGRPLTEYDVRAVCKEAGITAVGQSELSPALRELREGIDCGPTGRITTLLAAVPEQVQLVLLLILQAFVEYRIDLQHQIKVQGESQRQLDLVVIENYRATVKQKEAQCVQLRHLLDESRQNECELYERIRLLENTNAIMEGRLTERDTKSIRKYRKRSRGKIG